MAVSVGVDVSVAVSVAVGVFVSVDVGVAVNVAVGVDVSVAVLVAVGVLDGVNVAVGVKLSSDTIGRDSRSTSHSTRGINIQPKRFSPSSSYWNKTHSILSSRPTGYSMNVPSSITSKIS